MWLKVYQSVRCCEFSELKTAPCQSLTVPQVQISGRPIRSSVTIMAPSSPAQTSRVVHPPGFPVALDPDVGRLGHDLVTLVLKSGCPNQPRGARERTTATAMASMTTENSPMPKSTPAPGFRGPEESMVDMS